MDIPRTGRKCNQFECFQAKYEAEVEIVDFVTRGREVEKRANDWVSDKTNKMISNILPDGSLTGDTVLMLLNAVYFKGKPTSDGRSPGVTQLLNVSSTIRADENSAQLSKDAVSQEHGVTASNLIGKSWISL